MTRIGKSCVIVTWKGGIQNNKLGSCVENIEIESVGLVMQDNKSLFDDRNEKQQSGD